MRTSHHTNALLLVVVVVIDMFTRASQIDPNDSDVWAALGVLYNLTGNFDLAEAAFTRAIEIDPGNYSYWNKLGATQANGRRLDGSKIAIAAYRKALELKPNYVRAWVNMGVSYANQHYSDLAAKYYLKALRYACALALMAAEQCDLVEFG
jgi:peroxin-5